MSEITIILAFAVFVATILYFGYLISYKKQA